MSDALHILSLRACDELWRRMLNECRFVDDVLSFAHLMGKPLAVTTGSVAVPELGWKRSDLYAARAGSFRARLALAEHRN
jgi:hypothetical protein